MVIYNKERDGILTVSSFEEIIKAIESWAANPNHSPSLKNFNKFIEHIRENSKYIVWISVNDHKNNKGGSVKVKFFDPRFHISERKYGLIHSAKLIGAKNNFKQFGEIELYRTFSDKQSEMVEA